MLKYLIHILSDSVWGVDSVKSTFTVLEEGTSLKRGTVSIGVAEFHFKDTNFCEELSASVVR